MGLAAVDKDEDEDEPVLSASSIVKGLASVGGVLCLIASASCMDDGSTLSGIYWDIRAALSDKERITKAKTTRKSFFNFY